MLFFHRSLRLWLDRGRQWGHFASRTFSENGIILVRIHVFCVFLCVFMFFRSHVYLPGPTPIWNMLVVCKRFGFIPQMPPILRPESKRVHFCLEKHKPNLSDKSATRKRTHTPRASSETCPCPLNFCGQIILP